MIPFNLRPLPVFLALLGTSSFGLAAQFANFQVGSFNPSFSPSYISTSKTESVALGTLGNFTTTISTTASWALTGPATGVAIPETWVEPAYSGQLTGLTVLGFLASANSSVTIQFNFASLTGGFLPAGSVIAYNDIDGLEQVTFSTNVPSWYSTAPQSFYQVGTNVGSPWTTGQPVPGPSDIPSTAGSMASNLVLTGPGLGRQTDGVTNFIVTQVNLTSLNIAANGSLDTPFAQAVAIGQIPEPSFAAFIGAIGLISLLRRHRI